MDVGVWAERQPYEPTVLLDGIEEPGLNTST